MSHSRKFVPTLAVFVLCAALGLSLVSSKAAQPGVQAVGVQSVSPRPVFEKREFRAPNLGTQRTVGVVNSLNTKKNISKGISPDG